MNVALYSTGSRIAITINVKVIDIAHNVKLLGHSQLVSKTSEPMKDELNLFAFNTYQNIYCKSTAAFLQRLQQ